MRADQSDPATMLRLQVLSADLAQALATVRRRRRRVDEAIRDGGDLARRTVRLDRAVARVTDLFAEFERVARDGRSVSHTSSPGAWGSRAPGPASPRRPNGGGALVASAVDIGSNSVHLLVAVVSGHRLEPLLDVSEFLGLGIAVDDQGEIGEALRARLVKTLVDYVARARTLGARRTVLIGTDPLRRAADASLAMADIEAATGEQVAIVSHDEEAFLTLLGVTAGRPVRRDLVLVDIGGGSSEVLYVPVVGDPVAVGLPTGSGRLTRQVVAHDPPTPKEMERLLVEARRILEAAPAVQPAEVILVGGSATNLLRIVPAAALDKRLTARRVAQALSTLSNETAAEAAARHGMREPRARMMAAGASIAAAVIERYGVDRVRVDANGIREGLVLAAAHAGDTWREDLVWLAHGWSR